ncbi:MAG: TolC family protein [Ferruginibacter sp.]
MKFLITILLSCSFLGLKAQDSVRLSLSFEEYMSIVQQFHPIARQADIQIEKAKAALLSARGMFDPVFEIQTAQKSFDGVRYYNIVDPKLTIPTWYGIELYAGTNYLSGSQVDPTETIGESSFAGVSIPLARNLLIDKRRAALKAGAIYRDLSIVERRTIVNDLLLEAAAAYWNWVRDYEVLQVVKEAVFVNEKRMSFIRTSTNIGERAVIDTVEALAQLQQFRFLQNEANVMFSNAGIELSLYLWQQNTVPYNLSTAVIPAKNLLDAAAKENFEPVLTDLLRTASLNHPKLTSFDFKLSALEVDRRLKFQELLPYVQLKYNQLGKGYSVLKTAGAFLSDNNYQYGLSFSMPLRLSEGRASYRTAKLKITETSIQQDYTRMEILNKVKQVFNEQINIKNQIALQESMYLNYLRLQRAEETRFANGESSLFLINTRENKTIESMQKLLELRSKYFSIRAKLQNAVGVF